MRHRPPFVLETIALLVATLFLHACGEEPAPSSPTPPPPPTATAGASRMAATQAPAAPATGIPLPSASQPPSATAPAPTSTPLPTPTLPPTVTPTPTPGRTTTFDSGLMVANLGLPGGDCYQVGAITTDSGAGRLYVLCAHTDQGPADAIIALDSATGERLASRMLAGDQIDLGGQLALDSEAGLLYAVTEDLGGLVILDAVNLEVLAGLPGVWQVVPAPGTGRFYARTQDAIILYDTEDLIAQSSAQTGELFPTDPSNLLWSELLPSSGGRFVAYNAASDRIYSAPMVLTAAHTPVQVRRGDDLEFETEIIVTGTVNALAADGRADRIYVATGDQLIAIDGQTLERTTVLLDSAAAEGYLHRMQVDEEAGQVHLFGSYLGASFWQVMDGESMETLYSYTELPDWSAVAFDDGTLLTARSGADAVVRYDPATGQPVDSADNPVVLGRRLIAALPHPDSGQIYVVDSTGSLLVVDGLSLETVDSLAYLLPSGRDGIRSTREAHLALDPELKRLFLADVRAGQTLVLDLETMELVGTLEVGGVMAVDAKRGRLFVADQHVYLFDSATLETLGAPQGEPFISHEQTNPANPQTWAEDIVIDEAGDRIFVRTYFRISGPASRNMSSYGVYDADTLESLDSLSLSGSTYLRAPIALPGSHRILVAYHAGGGCPMGTGPVAYECRQGLVFFGEDFQEQGQIEGLTGRLMGNEEGLYLLRERDLLVLDPLWGFPLASQTLEMEVWDAVLDPSSNRFYFWSWDALGTLPTKELVDSIGTSLPYEHDDFVYASPAVQNDDTLFAAIPAMGIYRSTDGGERWQLTSTGLQNYFLRGLAFSPEYEKDGTLYVGVGYDQYYRSTDRGDTWNPNGTPRLAFVSDRMGNKEVYTTYFDPDIAPLGTKPQRLTDDPAQDDNPAWSPDGQRLVFQSDRSGNSDLWVVSWDGSGLVQLTTDPADDLLPAWSPDGERIAFVSTRDGNPDIYLVDAPQPGGTGGEANLVRLTQDPAGDWRPSWSPEGDRLAFASTRDGDNEIYVMNAAGTEPGSGSVVQMTDNDADDRDPFWHSSRNQIYFLSDRAGNFDIYTIQADDREESRMSSTAYDESHVVPRSFDSRFYVTEQSGNADIYYEEDSGPRIRRLTYDPANDTAPAWSVAGAPPPPITPVPTPTPSASPTSETPPATPAVEPLPLPPAPAVYGTPLPSPRPIISPQNAGWVVQIGQWGGGEVEALAYAPDASLVAAGTGGAIQLYDGQTMEEVRMIPRQGWVRALTFSPDARLLAATEWPDYSITLWQVEDGRYMGSLEGHTDTVRTLAFSPDGETLASGSWDKTVRLWNVDNGQLLHTLEGSTSWVNEVTFGPDGQILASASTDGTVRLWRASDGELLHTLKGKEFWDAESLAFSPDGGMLAAGGYQGTSLVWQVSDGRLLHALHDENGKAILALAFDQEGETLYTASEYTTIHQWDLHNGDLLATKDAYSYWVSHLVFSPEVSGWVTASTLNGALVLWRLSDGEPQYVNRGQMGRVYSLAFHPGTDLLAAGSSNWVRVRAVDDGYLQYILEGHEGSVGAIAYSPDGEILATGSSDQTVRLWQASDGELLRILEGHTAGVQDIAFHPDGETLASAGDFTVRIWRASDGTPLHTLEGHEKGYDSASGALSVAYSPDGKTLAAGTGDGSILLWATGDGSLQGKLLGHTSRITQLAYSPDGVLLASASTDQSVRLWQANDGEIVRILTDHEGPVYCIAFSPDGQILAAGTKEGTIRLWLAKDGSLLRILEGHFGDVRALAFSPDGSLLASGSWDLSLRLWGVREGE